MNRRRMAYPPSAPPTCLPLNGPPRRVALVGDRGSCSAVWRVAAVWTAIAAAACATLAAPALAQSLSEKGADPLRRLQHSGKSEPPPKGQTPFRTGSQPGGADEQAAIEAARDGLNGPVRFPWYDPANDALQRVDVRPPADAQNRRSTWEPTASNWNWNWRWPGWLKTILRVLGILVLAAVLSAVVFAVIRALLLAEDRTARRNADSGNVEQAATDAARIESLPFQLDMPLASLLDEARRAFEQGRYRDAMIFLYSHLLVELDRGRVIRLTKGKTNRQYLRESRRLPEVVPLFQAAMLKFEDVFFGNYPIARAEFERCWSGLAEFHRQLEIHTQRTGQA